MGLKVSVHDPCLFDGIVDPQDDPTDPASLITDLFTTQTDGAENHPVYVGIYVVDFAFYLVDPEEEKRFKQELEK